ncbi:hypothetical protein FPV67DRAFT_1464866 [Lyophyllum atratum]|nr:hypothetical protein FPV67DRAFT_1464866 [Lyophyllum atratum]
MMHRTLWAQQRPQRPMLFRQVHPSLRVSSAHLSASRWTPETVPATLRSRHRHRHRPRPRPAAFSWAPYRRHPHWRNTKTVATREYYGNRTRARVQTRSQSHAQVARHHTPPPCRRLRRRAGNSGGAGEVGQPASFVAGNDAEGDMGGPPVAGVDFAVRGLDANVCGRR